MSVKRSEIDHPSFSQLMREPAPSLDTDFDAKAWINEVLTVAYSPTKKNTDHASMHAACVKRLRRLASACASGNGSALEMPFNAELIEINTPRGIEFCSAFDLAFFEFDKASFEHGHSVSRVMTRAMVEAVALGHAAQKRPLIDWLSQASKSYARACYSEHTPPEDRTLHVTVQRALLLTCVKNWGFMRAAMSPPKASQTKEAHHHKIIDPFNLHAMSQLYSGLAARDPTLFVTALSSLLDIARAAKINITAPSYVMLGGEIVERSLPDSVDRGFSSWVHSPHSKSWSQTMTDHAQIAMADVLASRGFSAKDMSSERYATPSHFRTVMHRITERLELLGDSSCHSGIARSTPALSRAIKRL